MYAGCIVDAVATGLCVGGRVVCGLVVGVLDVVCRKKIGIVVSAVGFEPTSANTVELESTPLDRSGTLTSPGFSHPKTHINAPFRHPTTTHPKTNTNHKQRNKHTTHSTVRGAYVFHRGLLRLVATNIVPRSRICDLVFGTAHSLRGLSESMGSCRILHMIIPGFTQP